MVHMLPWAVAILSDLWPGRLRSTLAPTWGESGYTMLGGETHGTTHRCGKQALRCGGVSRWSWGINRRSECAREHSAPLGGGNRDARSHVGEFVILIYWPLYPLPSRCSRIEYAASVTVTFVGGTEPPPYTERFLQATRTNLVRCTCNIL